MIKIEVDRKLFNDLAEKFEINVDGNLFSLDEFNYNNLIHVKCNEPYKIGQKLRIKLPNDYKSTINIDEFKLNDKKEIKMTRTEAKEMLKKLDQKYGYNWVAMDESVLDTLEILGLIKFEEEKVEEKSIMELMQEVKVNIEYSITGKCQLKYLSAQDIINHLYDKGYIIAKKEYVNERSTTGATKQTI